MSVLGLTSHRPPKRLLWNWTGSYCPIPFAVPFRIGAMRLTPIAKTEEIS